MNIDAEQRYQERQDAIWESEQRFQRVACSDLSFLLDERERRERKERETQEQTQTERS